MSTLLRTNLGIYRVTVTRPRLTNNAVLWSVTQNGTRCPVGGHHVWDDGTCSKCSLIAAIQEDMILGHGFLYGDLNEGLDEALGHAFNVRRAADNLTWAIALDGSEQERKDAILPALRAYEALVCSECAE